MIESNIQGFQYIVINSFTKGSVLVDSSLIFSQTASSSSVQTALVNQSESNGNTLNIVSSSINVTASSTATTSSPLVNGINSTSSSNWWLPLAIIFPILLFLFSCIVLTIHLVLAKRKKVEIWHFLSLKTFLIIIKIKNLIV